MQRGSVQRFVLYTTVLAQICLASTSDSSQLASKATTSSGECALPPKPEFGEYTSTACSADDSLPGCRNVPGNSVPQYWLLKFTCDDGYKFDKDIPDDFVVCNNGSWKPSIPVCRRKCKPLKPLDMDVRCQLAGEDVDCSKSVPVGTEATGRCKEGYELTGRAVDAHIVCKVDGQWSADFVRCVPECGRKNPDIPLLLSGSPVSKPVLPWFVGIYRRNEDNQLEHICGGTLISPHIVLTAAHCVYSDRLVLSPQTFQVALGKRFRNWNSEEPQVVKAEVREIAVPPLYSGQNTRYAHDLALIDLKTSVQLTSYHKPACVDWTREFSVTRGQIGTLTVLDATEEGTISDTLITVELPYEDTKHCVSQVPPTLQSYITFDKFCATPRNGTNVTRGSDGGGLTFVQNGRHYVQGVLSTKFRRYPLGTVTFTSLKDEKLFDWLRVTKSTFDEAHKEVL